MKYLRQLRRRCCRRPSSTTCTAPPRRTCAPTTRSTGPAGRQRAASRSGGPARTPRCFASTRTDGAAGAGRGGRAVRAGPRGDARLLGRPGEDRSRRSCPTRLRPASKTALYRTGDLVTPRRARRLPVPRPPRQPGQEPRLSHRAGRGRGRALRAPGGGGGRGPRGARRGDRQPAPRLRRPEGRSRPDASRAAETLRKPGAPLHGAGVGQLRPSLPKTSTGKTDRTRLAAEMEG